MPSPKQELRPSLQNVMLKIDETKIIQNHKELNLIQNLRLEDAKRIEAKLEEHKQEAMFMS